MIDLDTWIISDTHFGHDNIKKYCGRPDDHDFLIYENWRKIVQPHETIIHLGDLTVWFGKKRHVWENACRALPGNKILILGNHDERDPNFYKELGFFAVPRWKATLAGLKCYFTHYPEPEKNGCDINFHGHIHNNITDEGGGEYWHRNCSIEVLNYKPARIRDIL